MWSLFYVMVEFLRGSLPWRKEKDRDKIGVLKVKLTNQSLLQGLPYPCLRILDHILSLQYSQRPDYSYLDSLLQDLFDCSGESESVPYGNMTYNYSYITCTDWDSELISDAQEQSQLQQEPKAPSATSNQQENQEPPIQLQQTSVFETAAVLNDVEQAEASLQKLSILPQPPSTDSKNGILSFPFRLRRFLQRK